jgi:hypothetical protein
MLHNFRASRKILQKSKTLGSDILPPSRQDAKRRIKRHHPTHGEVSEGEIKNILLRAFASLREIFRFFRLRLCRAGIFATFVVNVLFLFWLRLRRARRFVVSRILPRKR